MDVAGTLERLGFAFLAIRKHKYYRQFVPLVDGGLPPAKGERRISHVNFCMGLSDDDLAGRLTINYGYPTRHMRRGKIYLGFRPTVRERHDMTLNFTRDEYLREFEHQFSKLKEALMTTRVKTEVIVQLKDGDETRTVTPHHAMFLAVENSIGRGGRWFDMWVGESIQPDEPKPSLDRRSIHGRLPNFTRNKFRGIGRKV